jgi:hypothetical protein
MLPDHSTDTQSASFVEAAKKTGSDESGQPFKKPPKKIAR